MVMTQETIKSWFATQSVLQIQALFSDFLELTPRKFQHLNTT